MNIERGKYPADIDYEWFGVDSVGHVAVFTTAGVGPIPGPDFSSVDSAAKAEALGREGVLEKLLLMPAEFGGQDIPPNIVYVPATVVEIKERIDHHTIRPLLEQGTVTRYVAAPQYEGRSFIPSAIVITASEPGSFTATIAIWGQALREQDHPAEPDAES